MNRHMRPFTLPKVTPTNRPTASSSVSLPYRVTCVSQLQLRFCTISTGQPVQVLDRIMVMWYCTIASSKTRLLLNQKLDIGQANPMHKLVERVIRHKPDCDDLGRQRAKATRTWRPLQFVAFPAAQLSVCGSLGSGTG